MASSLVTLHKTTNKTLLHKNHPQVIKTWYYSRFQILNQTQAETAAMIFMINSCNLLLFIHRCIKKTEQRISAMKSTGSPSCQRVKLRRMVDKCTTYYRKVIHIIRVWSNRRNLNLLSKINFQELIDLEDCRTRKFLYKIFFVKRRAEMTR